MRNMLVEKFFKGGKCVPQPVKASKVRLQEGFEKGVHNQPGISGMIPEKFSQNAGFV